MLNLSNFFMKTKQGIKPCAMIKANKKDKEHGKEGRKCETEFKKKGKNKS